MNETLYLSMCEHCDLIIQTTIAISNKVLLISPFPSLQKIQSKVSQAIISTDTANVKCTYKYGQIWQV